MIKRRAASFACIFILTLLEMAIPGAAMAQENGAVAGVVVSTWDGAPLAGVVVTLRGTTLAAETDGTGRFELKSVPAGDHVLRLSKSSFATAIVTDIRVLPGQTTTVNGNLRPEFYEMEEYEVTAEEFTEQTERIIFDRQQAAGLMEAIGSESISRLGSSHAADVVTKVAGSTIVEGKFAVVRGLNDRYVPTTLNGAVIPSADPYRMSASLDQFPSALIDKVTVTKTFTPDLPGNFTGGGLDIETKSFPEKPFVKLSLGTAYNTQSTFNENFLTYDGGGRDWLGMDDGTRALPDVLAPGTLVPAPSTLTPPGTRPGNPAFEDSVARANTLNAQTRALGTAQFAPHTDAPPLDHSFGFSFGDTVDMKVAPLGFLGAFSYKRDFRFHEDGFQQRLQNGNQVSSQYDDARSVTTVNWAAMANVATRLAEYHEIGVNYLFSQTSQDSARHQEGSQISSPEDRTFREKIQYIERNLNTLQLEGSSLFPFLNNLKLDYLFGTTETTQDEPDTRFFNYVRVGDIFVTGQPFLPDPQNPTRYFAFMKENNLQGKIDLTFPFDQWSGLEAKIKGGVNGIYSDRSFWERGFFYKGDAPWVGGNPNDYLTGDNLGYAPTTNSAQRIRWNWQRYIGVFDSTYDSESAVEAAYLMMDLPVIESVRLIGGARVETTHIEVHSESFFESSITGLKINDSLLDRTDLLPAAGLVYSIRSNMFLRLNYSQTIARPSFRELAALRSYDQNLDVEFEGNPILAMSSIDNYDIRWEWYPSAGDLVSVSLFYKELENPIEQKFVDQAGRIVTWINRESATLMGIELEARKSLGTLHDSLSDFSIGGNFSWIESETELLDSEYQTKTNYFSSVSRKRALAEQAPYILNLDFSWDNRALGTTMSIVYNLVAPRLAFPSLITEDIYEQASPSLDFLWSQRLSKNLSLRFSAKNLLDPESKLTYGESASSPTFISYRRGRTFGLSLSLDF